MSSSLFPPFFRSSPPSLAETSLLRIKRWECVWWGDEVFIIHSEEHTLGDSAVQMNSLLLRSAAVSPAIVPKHGTCWAHRWSASAVSVSLVSGYEIKLSLGEVRNLTGKQEGIGGDPGQWFPFPHSFRLRNAFGDASNPNSVVIWWHCNTHSFTNMKWYSPRSFTQVFVSLSIILVCVCVCAFKKTNMLWCRPHAREAYFHPFFCHR